MVEGVVVVDNHELANAGVQKERRGERGARSDARTCRTTREVWKLKKAKMQDTIARREPARF